MQEIYPGSKGDDVLVARFFLNRGIALISPWLSVGEGDSFDDDMRQTLAIFQRERGIRHEPGYVGASTWEAIGLIDEIDHPVRLAPPDGALRHWWAAASIATSYRRRVHEADCLATEPFAEGLSQTPEALAAFAGRLGWSIHRTDRHMRGLSRHLRAGPVIVVGDYAYGLEGPFLHAVVLSGLWSGGYVLDSLVRMHDPLSPGRIGSRITTFPGLAVGPGHFEPRALLSRDATLLLSEGMVDELAA